LGRAGVSNTTTIDYPADGTFAVSTQGSERMRITSGGNVGIGTTSPSERLMVSGNVRASGYFQANDGTRDFYFNPGGDFGAGALPTIQVASNHALQFATNNTLRLTIASTGAATFSSSVTAGGNIQTDGAANKYIKSTGFISNQLGQLSDFGGSDAGYYFVSGGGIQFVSGGANRMILNSTGNVGIGTTSPGTTLDISASEASLRLTSSTGTNFVSERIVNTGGTLWQGIERSTGGVLGITGAYEAFLLYGADNPMYIGTGNSYLRFGTNSSERMRITSGGNVGIGTSSPTDKLVVVGGRTTLTANSEVYQLKLAYNTSTDGFWLGSPSADALAFYNNAGTERMRITSSGELLINTTSDAGDYKLQVNGNIYANGVIRSDNAYVQIVNSSNPSLYLSNNTIQWQIYNNSSNELVFKDGSYDLFKLTYSNGNATFGGSIKTAAPSGGTAAAWKLGERVASAGVTFNDQQYIQLDIAGTTYYLATVDLPMPEAYPQATSGPSNNYKMAPVQVKTTRDAELEKLRKEIEELKQLIKNK
jgi:hypothetical protein